MCLNQIFKDEQLAMMRYMWATSALDVETSISQLSLCQAAFQPFPYPHRPFVWNLRDGALPSRAPDREARARGEQGLF